MVEKKQFWFDFSGSIVIEAPNETEAKSNFIDWIYRNSIRYSELNNVEEIKDQGGNALIFFIKKCRRVFARKNANFPLYHTSRHFVKWNFAQIFILFYPKILHLVQTAQKIFNLTAFLLFDILKNFLYNKYIR